jgi:hypothetical protein
MGGQTLFYYTCTGAIRGWKIEIRKKGPARQAKCKNRAPFSTQVGTGSMRLIPRVTNQATPAPIRLPARISLG